jgi:hypothetical protein
VLCCAVQIGVELADLEKKKAIAVAAEDFDTAAALKKQMDQIRAASMPSAHAQHPPQHKVPTDRPAGPPLPPPRSSLIVCVFPTVRCVRRVLYGRALCVCAVRGHCIGCSNRRRRRPTHTAERPNSRD